MPGASAAIKATKTGKIGVTGTPMTIQSDIYREKIASLAPNCQVQSLACPKFAPLVESNQMASSLAKKVVYETLEPLVGQVDTLILGCTHYPLLKPIIQNVMGEGVKLVDSGAESVRDISVMLNYLHINHQPVQGQLNHQFYTTAGVESFAKIANEWLPIQIEVEHVDL